MSDAIIMKKVEESAVEVKAEIPLERVAKYRARALKELGSEISVPGFRTGSVPEAIILKRIPETSVLERAASIGISSELPEILAKEGVLAIETPKVTVTKLAPGNPIGFTASVSIMPEVALPDYAAIAKKENAKKETASVSEEEVSDMERFLRRERARIELVEKGAEPEKAHEETQKLEEKDLPALDDDFAKQLGAENADDLKKRMRENMLADKGHRATEKVRAALIDVLLSKMKIALPGILIEHELDRMMDQLAHDIEHGGSTMEAYLKHLGKTEADLRKEWRETAEKRAKVQLILREIAAKENIRPDEERITHELDHLKQRHKDVPEAALRAHVESALLPETVFRWLEHQG